MALTKVQILFSNARLFQPLLVTQCEKFHKSSSVFAYTSDRQGLKKWPTYNKKMYPPQDPSEEPRPAYVCHYRCNIKYSPWKMWYIACMIRGMPVDEAIKQLKFVTKKGAKDVREVLEEAKEIAASEHNVEFPSNMWVSESFANKGAVIKGIRRHARGRHGIIEYFHCHYFVTLEEGKPPEHYYLPYPKKPHEQLQDWLSSMRKRKIVSSL